MSSRHTYLFWHSSEATSVDAKATSPSEGRGTASSEALIASTQVGANIGSAIRVHAVLTPTTPEVIDNGESLTLEVNIASASGNAFCGATLNDETTN